MNRSLFIQQPDRSTRTYAIHKDITRIGRAPDNDVVLGDRDRSVSRWHAVFSIASDGCLQVEDLNSANGTRLNGQALRGRARLAPNDVVEVGGFRITVYEDASEDKRFQIQAANYDLQDLQKKAELLPLAGENLGSASQLKNVELLYEVGVRLARSHSVEEVTQAAVELLFRLDQVHRVAVMLWDEAKQTYANPDVHTRGAGKGAGQIPESYDPKSVLMSRTILNRVRSENRPILVRDASSEEALNSSASIMRLGIQAALCSPLTFQGKFGGILYADNLAEPDAFSENDFRVFTSIAAQTGLALANAVAGQELMHREVERQALMRYLPPQVAELISAPGAETYLNGQYQPLTVLFADIRGFTTMSEQMDARDVVALLREFFSAMGTHILDCRGTLDKYIGDCIMALFGAPVRSNDSARDGVRAAIRMQQEMAELNEMRQKRGLNAYRIGIGLHWGPAVVGNVGSNDRVQYTAIGDSVNVAARLVSKALAGQIIVSEAIKEKLPDYSGFEPLGEVALKGRTNTMSIYSVRWTEQALD